MKVTGKGGVTGALWATGAAIFAFLEFAAEALIVGGVGQTDS